MRGCLGGLGAGRLVLRTSTQVPFLTRDEIGRVFGLAKDQVRVVAKRVGGGFGGKQEMLTEDIVALAVLRTGRPVQLELTREEEFTAATTRHPMAVTVTLGATRDGTLTGLALDLTADTGAYGNHGPGVLFHAVEEAVTVYRCPNKRVDARAVYTNTVPAGAFRGYGLSQTVFAVESAIDELARSLGIDPVELRRRNLIREGDDLVNGSGEAQDVSTASIGVFDCLDLAEKALASGRGLAAPDGWATGTGIAVAMLDTIPPGGHPGRSRVAERPDGGYAAFVGTAEFGNGTTTVHRQIVAHVLGCEPGDVLVLLLRHRPQRARHRRLRVDRDRGGGHRDDAGGPRPGRRDRGPRGQRRGRRREAARGRGLLRRAVPVGVVHRPGVPGRGLRRHRRDPGAAVGPGGRRGHGAQPGPAARSGRGRGRRRRSGRRCSRRCGSTPAAG